jgi:hypothetical protein
MFFVHPAHLPVDHATKMAQLARHARAMHDAQMATKTISIETDVYDMLVRERREPGESFSRVIRRLFQERPALTCGELLEAMEPLYGIGAGPKRKLKSKPKPKHAAA